MSFHIAESREQARQEAAAGFLRWHNEYTVGTLMRPGSVAYDTADRAFSELQGSATVVGTPDDLVQAIREMRKITGGFGTVIGFAHDWASREATFRSWELVARHVIPELNGLLESYRESQRYVIEHREAFERGGAAIMAKINENERAAKALAETGQVQARSAFPAHHQPRFEEAGAAQSAEPAATPPRR
jgi:limonene 1,2-monooxygenase